MGKLHPGLVQRKSRIVYDSSWPKANADETSPQTTSDSDSADYGPPSDSYDDLMLGTDEPIRQLDVKPVVTRK